MSTRRSTRILTRSAAAPSSATKRPAPDEEPELKPTRAKKRAATSKRSNVDITAPLKAVKKEAGLNSEIKTEPAAKSSSSTESKDEGPRYWLFKSEPETRITPTGHDVRFSIDDLLASKDGTAPWDGVRNYSARNNLKAMRLGDLGFFYHSNCKEPGIVGVVEVVREAEPDEQAFDPKACYYDPKSSRDSPKWFQVQVKFKRKTKRVITLAEMKEYAGSELSEMPLLKAARLSVSPVPKACWNFILDSLESKEDS
ncbi:thymocyte nuclear protein 1 [Ascobolus immersus RN42]|uniref:Thymocyte nuclear protein 1 n=1 Tax=Ascobolus immersus RN42 TaxID=1160509 RepID=A0A3N4IH18_ASCIM|nr:thymocyte nuclear protein 1 [Ascobolus immersus RN42]